MHIYKTGGTSSRVLFANWAEAENRTFAQAGSCSKNAWMSKLPDDNSEYICLAADKDCSLGSSLDPDGAPWYDFPTPRPSQLHVPKVVDVLAGHMSWGFGDAFVHKPHKYFTCLRNPMARFVSDILYANRYTHKTSEMSLKESVAFVEKHIFSSDVDRYRGLYAARLSSRMHAMLPKHESQSVSEEREAANVAIAHLQNDMVVVGQIEHYDVFVELVAAYLDPDRKHNDLWMSAQEYHSNKHEGFDQSDVIPELSSKAVSKLNETLALDWKVYIASCRVTYQQCRKVAQSKAGKLHNGQCTEVRRTCGF